MSEVKTIKNVDENTWAEFKSLAAKNQVKLGMLFKTLVEEHERNSVAFWEDILGGEKILSDNEAEELQEVVHRLRKEYGFRK